MPPEDSESRTMRDERAWQIFEFLRPRTGTFYTHADLRQELGITSRRGYGEAMVRARKLARIHDENIIYNIAVDGTSAFCHVTPDNEDGRWFPGSHGRAQSIRGQIVNLADDLNWGANHARNHLERMWALANASSYNMIIHMAEEMTTLARAIHTERDGQTPAQAHAGG